MCGWVSCCVIALHKQAMKMDSGVKICRLCGTRNGLFLDIFGSDSNKVTYTKDIDTCLSVKVKKDDSLPHVICNKCEGELSECTPFVHQLLDQFKPGKKRRRSRDTEGKCSFCHGDENYLFPLPLESARKIATCFSLNLPSDLQICHRCQFCLDTLHELRLKSQQLQQYFLTRVTPTHLNVNEQAESVSDMVKKLTKKYKRKMGKDTGAVETDTGPCDTAEGTDTAEGASSSAINEEVSDDDVPLVRLKTSLGKDTTTVSVRTPSPAKDAVQDESSTSSPPKENNENRSPAKTVDKNVHASRSPRKSQSPSKHSKSAGNPKVTDISQATSNETENQSSSVEVFPEQTPHKSKRSMKRKLDSEKENDSSVERKRSRKSLHSEGANVSAIASPLDAILPSSSKLNSVGPLDVLHLCELARKSILQIDLLDTHKWLGNEFFAEGTISVKKFLKLMPENASKKRVHWAEEVEHKGHTPKVKEKGILKRRPGPARSHSKSESDKSKQAVSSSSRKRHTAPDKGVVDMDTETVEGSAPSRRPNVSADDQAVKECENDSVQGAVSSVGMESEVTEAVTSSPQASRIEIPATSETHNEDSLEDDKENEKPKRRRSAARHVVYEEEDEGDFDDPGSGEDWVANGDQEASDSGSDYNGTERRESVGSRRGRTANTDNSLGSIPVVVPEYLVEFDKVLESTPRSEYRPFICPECREGYISTVKGKFHKLMAHDPRSGFRLQLIRCDTLKSFKTNCQSVNCKEFENELQSMPQTEGPRGTQGSVKRGEPTSKPKGVKASDVHSNVDALKRKSAEAKAGRESRNTVEDQELQIKDTPKNTTEKLENNPPKLSSLYEDTPVDPMDVEDNQCDDPFNTSASDSMESRKVSNGGPDRLPEGPESNSAEVPNPSASEGTTNSSLAPDSSSDEASQELSDKVTDENLKDASENALGKVWKDSSETGVDKVLKEATEDISGEASKDTTDNPSDKAPEDAADNALNEASKDTTDNPFDEVPKGAMDSTLDEASKDTTDNPSDKAPEDAADNALNEASKDTTDNPLDEAPKDAASNARTEASKDTDTTDNALDEAPKDATDDEMDDASKDTMDNASEETSKDATDDEIEEASKDGKDNVPDVASMDTTDDALDEGSKDAADNSSNEILEKCEEVSKDPTNILLHGDSKDGSGSTSQEDIQVTMDCASKDGSEKSENGTCDVPDEESVERPQGSAAITSDDISQDTHDSEASLSEISDDPFMCEGEVKDPELIPNKAACASLLDDAGDESDEISHSTKPVNGAAEPNVECLQQGSDEMV